MGSGGRGGKIRWWAWIPAVRNAPPSLLAAAAGCRRRGPMGKACTGPTSRFDLQRTALTTLEGLIAFRLLTFELVGTFVFRGWGPFSSEGPG